MIERLLQLIQHVALQGAGCFAQRCDGELWPASGLDLRGSREVQAVTPECGRALVQDSAAK